jgi:hypothetical protein
MGLSLMNMLDLLSSVHVAHIACYWIFFLLHYIQVPVSPSFAKQIMPILYISCYNDSLVTWMVVYLTTAKFKPLIFSVSGFTLAYAVNMFMLMNLYDICLFPTQSCYIILCIWKVQSHVQIVDLGAPWEISSGVGKLFCRRCSFKMCLPLIPRQDKHKSLTIWSAPYGGLV